MSSNRFSNEHSRLLTKISTLGTSTALPITLGDNELLRLICVALKDIDKLEILREHFPDLLGDIDPPCEYYGIPDTWFNTEAEIDPKAFSDFFVFCIDNIEDFSTYLKCLSELHKRRVKYRLILSTQPMPTMIQVSPRSLIEFGEIDSHALASWLIWRKLLYDLDNRSAQETGYLFEPVLAAAIGGEPMSARSKVVRRSENNDQGRQVDCWKVRLGDKPLAYEFKLRVTIAASGQGRFGEELQFATDCQNSGAIPVLVVLDPTPNPRLRDLEQEYVKKGGHAYIGEEAWKHLEEEAGTTMGQFIDKYVRLPIQAVSTSNDSQEESLLPLSVSINNNRLQVRLGEYERIIKRE